MARKSRRNPAPKPVQKEPVPSLSAGAYCRLSVKDKDDSMETQLQLVTDFIKDTPELYLADTYIDDGYSGTGFDRPGWNRLMEDVRRGKIQCIVVKDLSRFGRDYLEAGYYIEKIFPKLNVRFIAITDHFDSTRPDNMAELEVPVKNMVNAAYAKDISRKLSAMFALRRERGERIRTATPPYGYRFEDGTRDRLVIDEEAARYVRMLFLWTRLGASLEELRRRMDLLEAPTPRQRQAANGIGAGKFEDRTWETATIGNMLENQEYCGDTVTGVTSTKLREKVRTAEESWVITENTHEPIITREEFAEVKRIREMQKAAMARSFSISKERWADTPNELQGLVYCGVCGHSLGYERRSGGSIAGRKPVGEYYCNWHVMKQRVERAAIPADVLKRTVMVQVQRMVRLMCEKSDLLKKSEGAGLIRNAENECAGLRSKITITESRRDSLYENYVSGAIDSNEYLELKEHYTQEIIRLEQALKAAGTKLRLMKKKTDRFISMAADIEEKYGRGGEDNEESQPFDEELVRCVVERIELFPDRRVEIKLRCMDEFAEILDIEM